MSYSFNLVDQPWIPCRGRGSPAIRELGIRDTLQRAHELDDLATAAPTETVTIIRLLLAVLHRVFGPADVDAWERLWTKGRFDGDAIGGYLDRWIDRFDLFHEERPFYQTTAISEAYAQSITRLGFIGDDNASLFDHVVASQPPSVRAGEAARLLLGAHSFDTGGLKSFEKGREKEDRAAKAAPLIQGAVALVRGANLFETLMLNLVRYNGAAGYPFEFGEERDRPAWEQDAPARAVPRHPMGYLDVLTWQSRRIRLLPEPGPAGDIVVRRAVLMKGHSFAEGTSQREIEPMLSFREVEKPRPGQRPWNPVGFREGRALWRDAAALFGPERAKSLEWLGTLSEEGVLPSTIFQVDYLGLAADRAKPLFWRHERLFLPAVYLRDNRLYEALNAGLDFSERVGRFVSTLHPLLVGQDEERNGRYARSPLRVLAEHVVGTEADTMGAFVRHLAPDQRYWPRLDVRFREFVTRLAEDRTVAHDGDIRYGAIELKSWRDDVLAAARAAFAEAVTGFGTTVRGIRAVAEAERALEYGLHQVRQAAEPPPIPLEATP